VFDAFIGQQSGERNRSFRLRRLGSHVIAIGLHALAITAAVQLAAAPRAPTVAPLPRAVPVHLGLTLSEACLRRPAARAPLPTPAAARATDATPRSRRRHPTPAAPPVTEPAALALTVREPTPMSELVSPATTSNAGPQPAAESPAAGAASGAGGTGAASGVNALAATPPRRPSRFLPELLAQQQKIAGAPPEFPASLATAGAAFVIQARICVGPDGHVDGVDLLRTAHPTLDGNVISAVGHWRYRPLLAGGIAVPFCTLVRFEFRAT
jgi:hypothetical protein